jgi:hypothetical protein
MTIDLKFIKNGCFFLGNGEGKKGLKINPFNINKKIWADYEQYPPKRSNNMTIGRTNKPKSCGNM